MHKNHQSSLKNFDIYNNFPRAFFNHFHRFVSLILVEL